jgi:uncharacterized cupredoxin-like copper-binding protein
MRRIAVLTGVCLTLAGCGGGGESSSSKRPAVSAQQTISISETEFSLDPSTVNIGRAGTVSFNVTNRGQFTHALEIEGKGVEEETDSIKPGDSATLKVQLSKAGSYEMYCPVDGHEDKGMKGVVRVGGSSAAGGAETRGGTTTDQGMTTTQGTSTDESPGYG